MSVPEGLRGTGRLEVIEKALDLADYTITITANSKIFLPEYQRSLTDDINRIALAIYVDAWTANNIKVTNEEGYMERRRLQERAARNCNNLLALMQLAQKVFHLKIERIKFWGEKTLNVRGLLRAWRESDYKRRDPIKATVAATRETENMKADIARNKAHNDYIAMMCDVEILNPPRTWRQSLMKNKYDAGFWTLEMVKNAVKKGKITKAEFEEITGVKYS